jgi:hypothetical protein
LFRPPLFAAVGASERLLLERGGRLLETAAVTVALAVKIAAEAALVVTLALAETAAVEPAEEVLELLVLVVVAAADTGTEHCSLCPVVLLIPLVDGRVLEAALDYTGKVQMAQGELGSCPDHISPKWVVVGADQAAQAQHQLSRLLATAASAITFVVASPVFSVAAVLAPLLVV